VSKSFAGKLVFCNATMSIKTTKPTIIMGRNGCGKSTLLKIIAGVLKHSEGKIIRVPNIKISFAPDRFPKLPFKVGEYMLYMGKIQGLSEIEINKYIDFKFDELGIPKGIKEQKIYKCSKGTIQKVNIMQAFLTKSDLLVMDEPFSGLDEGSIESLIELLSKRTKDETSIVLSCHEKLLAQRVTDNLYVFSGQNLVKFSDILNRLSIKIIATNNNFNFLRPVVISINESDGLHEIIIRKENLKEVLSLLLENEHEIYSVNPIA